MIEGMSQPQKHSSARRMNSGFGCCVCFVAVWTVRLRPALPPPRILPRLRRVATEPSQRRGSSIRGELVLSHTNEQAAFPKIDSVHEDQHEMESVVRYISAKIISLDTRFSQEKN